MRRVLAAVCALTLVPLLLGFKLIEPKRAWHLDDLPIEYYVGDAEPGGLDRDEKLDIIQASFDQWRDVPCSPLDAVLVDEIDNETSGFGRPDISLFTFDGAGRDDLGSGPLAATVTHASEEVLDHNGIAFYRVTSMNIIYNEGLVWATPTTVGSPDCHNAYDFQGVTTHEIGHGLGLGHSCDDGEACPDPLLRGATMYWSVQSCNDAQQVPNDDDWSGINTVYGVALDFVVADAGVEGEEDEDDSSSTIVGPAPLTVDLSIPETFQGEQFTSYQWNFGDGSERVTLDGNLASLPTVTHTYEVEGQYTITLSVDGIDEECGGYFDAHQRKVGVVLACDEPEPDFGFENLGDFSVALENLSPLGAFGCITDFEWILDGNEDEALRTYEPTWTFDEAGTHTVTLRASGPGGSGEVSRDVEVARGADSGCDCGLSGRARPGAMGFLALLLLGLVPRRRVQR